MPLDVKAEAEKLIDSVDTSANLMRSNAEWRVLLAKECQVYSCGQAYLGKRFDEINYQFCDLGTAEDNIEEAVHIVLSPHTDDLIVNVMYVEEAL